MIKKDMKSTEIKFGIVKRDSDDSLFIVETDKDGNELDTFTLDEIFERYVDDEYITLKIQMTREI